MRNKDRLYKANKHNLPLFADVDRERNNIFGWGGDPYVKWFIRRYPKNYSPFPSPSLVNVYKPATISTADPSPQSKTPFPNFTQTRSVPSYYNSSLPQIGETPDEAQQRWERIYNSPIDSFQSFQNQYYYDNNRGYGINKSGEKLNKFMGAASSAVSPVIDKFKSTANKMAGGEHPNNTAKTTAAIGAAYNIGKPLVNKGLDKMAKGYESKGGQFASTAGDALISAGAMSGNPYVLAAGAAVKLASAGVNRLFGKKVNKQVLEAKKQGINTLRNFSSDAGSMDGIVIPQSITTANPYKGGKFSNAKKRNRELNIEAADAKDWAERSVANNVFTINNNAVNQFNRDFYSEGGPIETVKSDNMNTNEYALGGDIMSSIDTGTATGFSFMSDYLNNKSRQNSVKDSIRSPFAGTPKISTFFADGGALQAEAQAAGQMPERMTVPRRTMSRGKKRRYTPEEYAAANIGTEKDGRMFVIHPKQKKKMYITDEQADQIMEMAIQQARAQQGAQAQERGMFALGGDIQMNGADFTTGLTKINAGGSHSENPNDGVQMGVDSEGIPNLVEEGETIFNDYVFSNRILVDDETKRKFHLPKKKDFTFADVSKRLEKESLERPNDPISKAALKKQLEKLEEEQERQKAEMDEAKVDAAWEALSPEEKMELMQYAEETEQQEAQAQQQAAMEQEAAAQQQMAQQGMSPEQQMAMQQQGISPEEAIAQEQAMQEQMQGEVSPVVAAYGGPIKKRKSFDDWYKTVPSDRNDSTSYNLRRAYELAPTSELEAWRKSSIRDLEAGRNHLRSVYKDPKTGIYEFMKSKNHPTISKELDWYYGNTPDAVNFRNQYDLDTSGDYYRYVPKKALGGSLYTHGAGWTRDSLYAEGGNLYPDGGELKKALLKALASAGVRTLPEFSKWGKDNKIVIDGVDWDDLDFDKFNWENAIANDAFRKAIAGENSTLAHVLGNKYDFGAYSPSGEAGQFFDDMERGNWDAQLYEGWKGSKDRAWLEVWDSVLKKHNNDEGEAIKELEGWKTKDFEEAFKKTNNYKATTKWLQDSEDNRLRYLEGVMHTTSPKGKAHALKFIDYDDKTGKATWKKDVNKDYNSIFGVVRNTYPGSYWHSVSEVNRDEDAVNWIQDDEGNWQRMVVDPDDTLELADTYKWWSKDNDKDIFNTHNYYRKKGAAAEAQKAAEDAKNTIEVEELKPKYYDDRFMFAPIVGSLASMGLWSAGVGKPDWNSLVRAAESGSGAWRPAAYKTIGDYMTYNPMDVWANQNKNTAVSKGTDRAIMNNLTPVGTKNASLVANAYNTINANGDLYRKAEEYNNALESQVKEFNRGTNKYNADAFNQVSQFNAGAFNQAAERDRTLRYQAASDAMNAKAGWYNSLYGNIGKLADNLGNLGKFNANRNMLNWMISKGLLGRMDPDDPYLKDKVEKTGQTTTVKVKSEGGSVKRRKGKKRGLTF